MLAFTVELRSQAHVARERGATIRWERYRAVRDAHEQGLSWARAHEDAVGQLEGTSAEGEATTMKEDYRVVKADLRDGLIGRYNGPSLPNQETRERLSASTRRRPPPHRATTKSK